MVEFGKRGWRLTTRNARKRKFTDDCQTKSPGDRTKVHQNSPDLNFKEFQVEGSTTRISWPREGCMAVRSGLVDASLVEGFTWHLGVRRDHCFPFYGLHTRLLVNLVA